MDDRNEQQLKTSDAFPNQMNSMHIPQNKPLTYDSYSSIDHQNIPPPEQSLVTAQGKLLADYLPDQGLQLPADTRAKIDKKTDDWLEELRLGLPHYSLDRLGVEGRSGQKPEPQIRLPLGVPPLDTKESRDGYSSEKSPMTQINIDFQNLEGGGYSKDNQSHQGVVPERLETMAQRSLKSTLVSQHAHQIPEHTEQLPILPSPHISEKMDPRQMRENFMRAANNVAEAKRMEVEKKY